MQTAINHKWILDLPEHRALRPEWQTGWEVERLNAMYKDITKIANTGKRPVVYDIGTEEGDLSALYSNWGADVLLFEPNPKVWPNIKYIWESNKLRKPLACFVGFVGEASNTEYLSEEWPSCADGELIGNHGFLNLCEAIKTQDLITSLDALILMKGRIDLKPDIIAMDIEGAEYNALIGAKNVLEKFKPIVYLSLHPEFMFRMYDKYTADIFNIFKDLNVGYKYKILAFDHEFHIKFYV